mgnify:CR=1 FL=1|tara:strand:- start:413 stop:715 length:303 start_codon:yes stop_codon:yes gene_type:complete
MAPPASDMPLAAEDYELYMPLLEAMRLDLEETLEGRPNAVFYPGRSIVVNRFLATLRSILGEDGRDLVTLDERGEISAQSVCSTIKSYHSALLSRAPSDK